VDEQTHQSWCFEDERRAKERQIVPCVEAVPERAEEKDASNSAPTLVDNIA